MRELHQPLGEIKKLEWEELMWLFDEVYRAENPGEEIKPVAVEAKEEDDDGSV